MDLGGFGGQFLGKKSPVTDDSSPAFCHAAGKIRQDIQQRGVFLLAAQDLCLVLQQFVVFADGQFIPGAQLAQSHIQKAAPGRRALPDQIQVFRRKQHAAEHFGQIPLAFAFDPVYRAAQPPAPWELKIHGKIPLPGADLGLDACLGGAKGQQIPSLRSPPGTAAGAAGR